MDDYRYKWVRVVAPDHRGTPVNQAEKLLKHGWEKVPADEVPGHLKPLATLPATEDSVAVNALDPHAGTEQGGLVLMRLPEDKAKERDAYYAQKNSKLLSEVFEDYTNNSDPRVPKFVEHTNYPGKFAKLQAAGVVDFLKATFDI